MRSRRSTGLAQLPSTQKENPYKVKTYQRAAAQIRALSESIDILGPFSSDRLPRGVLRAAKNDEPDSDADWRIFRIAFLGFRHAVAQARLNSQGTSDSGGRLSGRILPTLVARSIDSQLLLGQRLDNSQKGWHPEKQLRCELLIESLEGNHD